MHIYILNCFYSFTYQQTTQKLVRFCLLFHLAPLFGDFVELKTCALDFSIPVPFVNFNFLKQFCNFNNFVPADDEILRE